MFGSAVRPLQFMWEPYCDEGVVDKLDGMRLYASNIYPALWTGFSGDVMHHQDGAYLSWATLGQLIAPIYLNIHNLFTTFHYGLNNKIVRLPTEAHVQSLQLLRAFAYCQKGAVRHILQTVDLQIFDLGPGVTQKSVESPIGKLWIPAKRNVFHRFVCGFFEESRYSFVGDLRQAFEDE